MKPWGRECHLLFVTSCIACYYGTTYENACIRHIRWSGYLCGANKVVNFKQEDYAGTDTTKKDTVRYDNYVVVEVTYRLFFASYKVIGPVSKFYKFLPKEEQEVSRELWEMKSRK
jgi:hypothetical protein